MFFSFSYLLVLYCSVSAVNVLTGPPAIAASRATVRHLVRHDAHRIQTLFPKQGFEDQVEFWKEMFVRYGEGDVVFHDRRDVRLIYAVVHFDEALNDDSTEIKRRSKFLKQKKEELEEIFDDLEDAYDDPNGSEKLGLEHREMVDLLRSFGYRPSKSLFKRLKDEIRHQRGVRGRFQLGVIRSGMYLDAMEKILRDEGLPTELAIIPHVESSFDYAARSSVGAVGIWQLMRGTARRLLKISRSVDERLDPIKATEAAARLLKQNYNALGTWPLAITAYNHGVNGMLRAKNQHGSELRRIIDEYESKIFGFASKNFYAEFLAALEIAQNYQHYFGPLPIAASLRYDTVRLERALNMTHFAQAAGVEISELRSLNPHVTRHTWERSRVLPAGIELRIPPGKADQVTLAFQTAPAANTPLTVSSRATNRYRVRSGDTLAKIAKKFGTTVEDLKQMNRIRNPNQIRTGQVLTIP